MSLISLFADLSGLTAAVRENTSVMVRIAEALERVSPPLRDESTVSDDGQIRDAGVSPQASMAESPEEYAARTQWEAELALSLGMAPWAPQVQVLLHEMRQDLMRPKLRPTDAKMVPNEEGTGQRETALTEAEAIQAVRDAFAQAIAQANTR